MRTKLIVIVLVAVFAAISAWAWRASAEDTAVTNGDKINGTITLNGPFGNNSLSQGQLQFFNPKTNTFGLPLGQVLQTNPNSITSGQPSQGSVSIGVPLNPNGGFQVGTQGTTVQLQTISLGCGTITATPTSGTGTLTLTGLTVSVNVVSPAMQALDDDVATRAQAIQTLREMGPGGLKSLLDTYPDLIAKHATNQAGIPFTVAIASASGQPQPDPAAMAAAKEAAEQEATKWNRLKVALDAVGGQKDNHTAKLFWFTDLEAAKAAAKESGKPILSLRLLGKLTDELSCANSRFFRTMLYPNAEINKALRESFILHWETVRNVPIVTIDFGDGRKIVRTLTGNSIHYVLDSEGRPIEAIPGLYGPAAFLRQLTAAKELNEKLAKADQIATDSCRDVAPGEMRIKLLREYHDQQEDAIRQAWSADLEKAKVECATPVGDSTAALIATYVQATTDEVWQKIAALHNADAQLDAAGVAAVQQKTTPTAMQAGVLAIRKSAVETPWMKMVRNVQDGTALDTVKNEYTLHRQIHEWFAQGQVPENLKQFNDRVYAQLFLMPANDPWLGLSLPDQFSGITNGGLEETQTAAVEKK